MADRYYAKAGPIEPIALPDETICIWVPTKWVAYKVEYLEPIPRSKPLVFDQGAIAAGSTSGDTKLSNLKLTEEPPELLQLRFYPIDDILVTLKRGAADYRFKFKERIATADRFTLQIDSCLHTTEFVVLKTDEPHVDCENPSDYDLAQSRVAFFGFRCVLVDLNRSYKTSEEAKAELKYVTFVAAGGM